MLFFLFIFLATNLAAIELPPSTPIEIPMRDGTFLTADVYLPEENAKNLPTLLIRSPSGRQNPFNMIHLPLLKEGYALVIQDTRSAKDAEGKTLPYHSDGWGEHMDGYDTVSHLANLPFTNGDIGTLGTSAMGITQLLMAPTNPPALKAQYVSFATSDLYHHGLFQGGDLYKNQVEEWLKMYARHPDVYKQIYSQPQYNEFWAEFNILPLSEYCHCPTLHLGGWYDVFLQGTLDTFTHLQYKGGAGAKGKQKLVIGPWIHLYPLVAKFGEYDYPPQALKAPFNFSSAEWFDYHLKGEKNDIERLPPVLYFVMGTFDGSPTSGNVWKTANEWPVPHEIKTFYLQEDRKLASIPSKDTFFRYTYHPENPIPTLGGKNLFLPAGPFDQKAIENRKDLISFTTDPLEQDLEITGNIKAVLFFDTNQEDTSFSVRLTDVYPDGKSLIIGDGNARASHEAKWENGKRIVEVDIGATSLVFSKGHQIRILVSSSNYPRFEKNLNSLKRPYENPKASIAENTIFVGPKTPSRLLLPQSAGF
jgi:uncharacterized protein